MAVPYVPITALYAALLALIATVLAFQVGSMRGSTKISILHGDNMELAEKMRRHQNFTEAVPMALILFAVVELNGASTTLLHALGGSLVLARIAHPMGLHHDNIRHPLRAVGAIGTLLVTLIAAGVALWQFAGS